MNSLLRQNKKAVSEMISYTLLIIIAIGAGTLVFVLFQLYVPKEEPECNPDISLIIDSYECNSYSHPDKILNVTVLNKGKFNITAAYIRVGENNPSRTTRYWLNRVNSQGGSNNFYFPNPLAPNEKWKFSLGLNNDQPIDKPGTYLLEVQPAVIDPKVSKLAACPNKAVQVITCK